MHSRGRLTDEELQQAIVDRLVFDRAEAMPERDCLALIQHFADLPPPAVITAPGSSPPAPPPPAPPDKPFTLPPWVTTQSNGRLRYRPPTKPQPVQEAVPF